MINVISDDSDDGKIVDKQRGGGGRAVRMELKEEDSEARHM